MNNGTSDASITTAENTTVRITCKGCSLSFNAGLRQTSTLLRGSPHQSSPEVVNSHHIAFQSPRWCVWYRSPQLQDRSAQVSISLGNRYLQLIYQQQSTASSTRKRSRSTYNKKAMQTKGCFLLVTASLFMFESLESSDQILPVQPNFTENHHNYTLPQSASNLPALSIIPLRVARSHIIPRILFQSKNADLSNSSS